MSELADTKAERVKRQKNEVVAEARRGSNTDLQPTIDVWRDGRFLAGIVCRDVDRDQALQAVTIAVPGFGADAVILSLDAHMTSSPTNPKTGEPWGPNEMQGLCNDEGACDSGLITDCMMIQEVGRDGTWAMLTLPYHTHASARTIAWYPEVQRMESTVEGQEIEGYVADVVRHAFETPDIFQIAAQEKIPGSDAPEARLYFDIAIVKALLEAGFLVAYNPANEKEAAIVARQLEVHKVTNLLARLEAENN